MLKTTMNALRFVQKGAIESILKLEQVSKPSLAPGEAWSRSRLRVCSSLRSPYFFSLLIPAFSPIALGSKVGSLSPPYPASLVGTSLGKLSKSPTRLPRIGSLPHAHVAVVRFTKVKVAELSRKPKALTHPQAASLGLSLMCAWIAVHHLSEVKSTDNVLVIGNIHPLIAHFQPFVNVGRLIGARGGIGSGVIQLLKENGVAKICGTYCTVSQVSSPSRSLNRPSSQPP
jgi:hypothetical protein